MVEEIVILGNKLVSLLEEVDIGGDYYAQISSTVL